MPPEETGTAYDQAEREEKALRLIDRLSKRGGIDHKVPEKELLVRDLVYLIVLVGGMLLSYGKLAEKVDGVTVRIERLERQFDTQIRGNP